MLVAVHQEGDAVGRAAHLVQPLAQVVLQVFVLRLPPREQRRQLVEGERFQIGTDFGDVLAVGRFVERTEQRDQPGVKRRVATGQLAENPPCTAR